MADQLGELRPKLVDQCSEPILKDILDDLQEKKILSRGEVEEINANHRDRGEKVRLLVDIVKKKGDKASNSLIQSLSIRDPVLSEDLDITAPSLPAQQQNIQTPSQTDPLHELRTGLIEGCNDSIRKDLLDDLLHEKIINDREVESIENRPNSSRDKTRAMLDTVKRKGDTASNFLIQKVAKRDPTLSAKLGIPAPLESSLPTQEQNVEPLQIDDNGITLCSKKEYDRICTNKEEFYSILPREERTRLALIICNDKFNDCKLAERHGAKYDVEGMEKLLRGLGYEVQITNNLTVEGMKDTMKKFAADEKHMSSDSTFLVFMSHGFRDVICATDTKITSDRKAENALHVDEIFTAFNNENCQALTRKPKVVIIQACRGDKKSRVMLKDGISDLIDNNEEQMEDDGVKWIQPETDFILFYATTPGTVSRRIAESGSPFIQRLIEHTKKEAYKSSIYTIFQGVKRSFENGYQMPTIERDSTIREFHLCPGH